MSSLDGLRAAVLSELGSLLQDNILHGLIQLIDQLRARGNPHHPVVLDLCCLVRTLWQLRSLETGQLWREELMAQGIQWIRQAKEALQGIFALLTQKTVDQGALMQRTHTVLWELNRFQAIIRFRVAPPEVVLNKGGGLLVCQKHGPDRYKLDNGCAFEDEASLSQGVWNSLNCGIFEHIGLKSGGVEYYDPMFWSRGISSAKDFFTVGRVFMMLWDVNELRRDLQEVVDDEPSILARRREFMNIENAYTGPYTGPSTVRRFVAVAQGIRSLYCLPISTFNGLGCSQQQDQQSYGIVFTGDPLQAPHLLPGETEMIHPPLYIEPMAPKPWRNNSGGLTKTDVPPVPSNSELPSLELPTLCRIDYRRICEVEYNVCCRNIGMVSSESCRILKDYAAFVGLATQHLAREDVDAMDLT
ncbi:uncharacterized protein BJX67DRAFT_307811 [Aspergillus lucknowensis]|uniref:DUF6590 domain-containing protein n=1 Tax=Aspergillus lucknowensis TaxID=176173 RepID=A0ABR4M2T1_9EURO